MTDATIKMNETLDQTCRAVADAQHRALDHLTNLVQGYRVSLRAEPSNGLARINFLKEIGNVVGLLSCADGKQSLVQELRQAAQETTAERDERENAEYREGLVNNVLAAAAAVADADLHGRSMKEALAIDDLEMTVHGLHAFDEELDESDDDAEDAEDWSDETEPDALAELRAERMTLIPGAPDKAEIQAYTRKSLPELFRMLGLKY